MMQASENRGSGYCRTTSLDPHETSLQEVSNEDIPWVEGLPDQFRVTPIEKAEVAFRHSGWLRNRRRVWLALSRTNQSGSRRDRFCNCGSGCTVHFSPSRDAFKLSANYCRDRVCTPCGIARSRQVERAVKDFVGSRTVRFVTFTLRHNKFISLKDQLDRLYACFVQLRRRIWWKGLVTGGCAILEVKVGQDGLWHPHLHCLIEGEYLPHNALSREWYAVTGDSSIVDVRRVGEERNEIKYVCSYVGKPLDQSIYNSDVRLDEFIVAIKGRRLIVKFGSWSKLDIDADPPGDDDWIFVGTLSRLCREAKSDRVAAQLLRQLYGLSPLESALPPPEGQGKAFTLFQNSVAF